MMWLRWRLKSKNWERRLLVVRQLRTQKPPASVETLLPILVDRADSVRRAALTALDRNHPDWRDSEAARSAVRGWAKNLATDPMSESRERAAIALGLVRSGDTVPSLISALQDDRPNVRRAAVESLGVIGDPNTIEAVRAATADEQIGTVAREILKALEKQHPAARFVPLESKSEPAAEASIVGK